MSVSARHVAIVTLLLLGLAACQPAAGSVPPATPGSTIASSTVPPSVESTTSPEASASAQAGQTDTAWGRIWDSLPGGFPAYPGSAPAEEATTGPASAVFAIQALGAKTIAAWMQSKLEQASYSTEALNGPLEDGSYVLDSTGPAPGCRVEVSIAPLGGLTTVTVLYGASCPKP